MAVYKRGKTYWIRFHIGGREIRKSARTIVRAVALEYERREREKYNALQRGDKPAYTYNQAMERFILEYMPSLKLKTRQRYLTSAKQLHSHFTGRALVEIGRGVISDYQAYRMREGVNNATINRDITCLSSMLTCAMDWGWIDHNPVRSMVRKKLRENPKRTRVLSEKEQRRLEPELEPIQLQMLLFTLETGIREEEMYSLAWPEISERRREMTLNKTKTDAPRVVPLTDRALAQLRAQVRYLNSDYVFNEPSKQTRYSNHTRGFKAACARAGIKDFTWHDTRRTFATRWLQDGKDIVRLSKVLGHKSIRVTVDSYGHLVTKDLHETMGTSRTKTGTEATVKKGKRI